MDLLVYHRVRSIELDIHVTKSDYDPLIGDWFVYHGGTLGSTETSCHRLSDCLDELAAWQAAFPEHEVLTVWIDLKDDWAADHLPADLDALLTAKLGGALLTPQDLLDACPAAADLRDAIAGACPWPALEDLRGKMLVTLTGGGACTAGTKLDLYVGGGSQAAARVGFIAPDVNDACPVSAYAARPWMIVGNMNFADRAWAEDLSAAGLIGRVWGDELNTEIGWDAALGVGVHHLGTDKANYHQDTWSLSHNAYGWPFTCFVPTDCDPTQVEPGRTIAIEVASEDIWNSADNFLFASQALAPNLDGSWTALLSSPNSHVDEFGKACLMARANIGVDAPYIAMCRTADANRLRLQARVSAGSNSSEQQVDIVPPNTVDQESLAFVRLDVTAGGTCATGFGSLDGQVWVEVGNACVTGASLALQGIAASSHGNPGMKHLFSNLAHDGAPVMFDDFDLDSVGTVYAASGYDGVMQP